MRCDAPKFPMLIKRELKFDNEEAKNIHTFSVLRAADDKKMYYGYAGFDLINKVELWYSDDLIAWRSCSENPILKGFGFRWPSVIKFGKYYYMAVRKMDSKIINRLRLIKDRMLNVDLVTRMRLFVSGNSGTFIELYKSSDGVNFYPVKILVDKTENGNPHNQNPFLFYDERSKKVGLLYYSGNGSNNFEIRLRLAKNIEKLDESDDILLIKSNRLVAAPSVFYDPYTKVYWLLVESIDNKKKWIIKAFYSDNITGPYSSYSDPILTGDIACPFPYVENENLYLFVSKRVGNHVWKEELYIGIMKREV